MKKFRNVLWIAFGAALFLSVNLLLSFTSPAPAQSTLPPTGIESPAPTQTEIFTIPGLNDFELAQAPGTPQFQRLAEADRLYREGQTEAAERIYREVKPAFSGEGSDSAIAAPVFDPQELPPAAKVYWREAQEGFQRKMETRVFAALPLLVQQHPQFIPAHVLLAQAFQQSNRPDEAIEVLERATTIYPDQPDLVKAKVEVLKSAKKPLEASIAARQFALVYPEHPQAAEFAQLAEQELKSYQRGMKRKLAGQAILSGAISLGDFLLTGNAAGGIPTLQLTLMLLQGESSFGKQIANAVKQEAPMVDDKVVVDYVTGLGQKVAKLMGRDFEYEFFVIKDEAINAFALPGGKVFVNTGALMNSDSEAELVGLLGHEVSHAVLSHGYQRMVKGALLSNLNRVIPFGDIVGELIGRAYSRQSERQADILGARVLASSNYAADGLRDFMVTLNKEHGGKAPPVWLSTHPASADRVEYLEEIIQRNGYNRYAYEGVAELAAIKDRVKQLVGSKDAA